MKKALLKSVSVILALSMILTICVTGASASNAAAELTQTTWTRLGSTLLGGIIQGLLTGLNLIFPDSKSFIDKEDYKNENFYEGTGSMLDEPAANAQWKLGYANTSLVPDDWQEHTYYLGGYIVIENGFVNNVEGVIDDMEARIIAIEDGSGRGISLFCTIDSIGMTNGDIKNIRKALVEKAAGKYEFASVNVFCTHAHSGIDTEGLWTNLLPKVLKNIPKSLTRIGKLDQGTDPHYMEFLTNQVSDAMLAACDAMEPGTMTKSTKQISPEYFSNKNRRYSTSDMQEMTKLEFTPDNAESTPTMIVNIAAHPDVAGLPTEDNSGREVCGEYVYYMGETLANYGYNCMFFNGAIAGIYMGRGRTNNSQDMDARYEQSMRFGVEMAKIALSLNKTPDEIMADTKLYDAELIAKEKAIAEKNGGTYRLWFDETWTPVEAVPVDPILNVKIKEVFIPVTNPFIQLAGKLNLANYAVLKAGFKKYEIGVEIGYLEFGKQLKVVMMPGEICQDLISGGASLTAENSYSGKAFQYPCIREMFNDESIICFGLANDAIGYVVPDTDYCMSIAFDHYQELISLGKYAASTIMAGFTEIAQEVNDEVIR